MVDPPVFDLVVSIWFDSAEQAGAFRQYNEALQAYPKKFANWSKSFFLYVRQFRLSEIRHGADWQMKPVSEFTSD